MIEKHLENKCLFKKISFYCLLESRDILGCKQAESSMHDVKHIQMLFCQKFQNELLEFEIRTAVLIEALWESF